MDFFTIKSREAKKGEIEIYPDFKVCRSGDLMVRGKSFYAIWDPDKGMWSQDEYDAQRLIDHELQVYAKNHPAIDGQRISVKYTGNFSSTSWLSFQKYMKNISDNSHTLDDRLTFSNTEVNKKDYVSKRLPYPLEAGDYSAWDELISTLYEPEERNKIEWAIGSIVAGDAKSIQKFLVLYGEAGAGKSTILNVIQELFTGYYTTFEAKALTSSSNAFSTEVFKGNPLVAIQHDGDLSRIEDNTKLNSIISHEEMTLNEKYKPSYTARINCFLFMATNKPVKITDAKSGIIRRLIDVRPSGRKIPPKRYSTLMSQIRFELGAIAWHCREVYQDMGKNYYNGYRPIDMIFKTDVFFNFVEDNFLLFAEQDGTSLKAAYKLYTDYCEESGTEGYRLPRYKFREELKNYFDKFEEMTRVEGKQVRSWYSGFQQSKFKQRDDEGQKEKEHPFSLVLDQKESPLDILLADCPAQYASSAETPMAPWSKCPTTLKDLDTTRLHYVKVPKDHIVIDFDLRNEKGEKDPQRNLEAASQWPSTYAEFSKGGSGIHLHYIYKGDANKLSRIHSEGIEVKVPVGNASIRRRLSLCNGQQVAVLTGGLKEKEQKMVTKKTIEDEKHLRSLIFKALKKETDCGGTKPNVEFIFKLLSDARKSGIPYDVSDLYQKILWFASESTNHASYCVQQVARMRPLLSSEDHGKSVDSEAPIAFFDVEVFPNLCLVVYKFSGAESKCIRLFNPSVEDIEQLLKYRLIGFNCREYDNHILRGILDGYSNKEIYRLSSSIIHNRAGTTWEAKNYSYTDVYDYCSKKQSLKKWEIELGIFHKELNIPWDQPVPEDKWNLVAEYCDNDVIATEAVHNARKSDFIARQILAEIAGGSVNDTTNQLTTKLIFGDERNPQKSFNYRKLGEVTDHETCTMPWDADREHTLFGPDGLPVFPGYSFALEQVGEGTVKKTVRKSLYRGEEVGEGGYVYAEPGFYGNVALLDIASMHPSSIVAENLFGPYTKRFKDLLDIRIAIKHREFDRARHMFDGKLAPFLNDEKKADELSGALKIAINSVYGLTSASFINPFRDPRNEDNIVAKRGALFMVNLKHLVQEAGFTVAHIKTDSIKIPDATPEIIQTVMDYGKLYGYNFEHEATYDKMCLVNDAVYIAKVKEGKHAGEWTAVGAQFQKPYVFKKIFSKEPIVFDDLCETKSVKTEMTLDFCENLPEGEHDYQFVGRVGSFCPVKPGCGGGMLMRKEGEKYNSVTGSKGYLWKEAYIVRGLHLEDQINYAYFDKEVSNAILDISKYVDPEWFTSDDPYVQPYPPEDPPLEDCVPCGEAKYSTCFDCPKFHPMDSVCPEDYLATTCDAGYSLDKIYAIQNKE